MLCGKELSQFFFFKYKTCLIAGKSPGVAIELCNLYVANFPDSSVKNPPFPEKSGKFSWFALGLYSAVRESPTRPPAPKGLRWMFFSIWGFYPNRC